MSARKKKLEERTGFTPRKIALLSAAVLLFSAIVSILLTANSSNNRASQFVRGAFEGRGVVENGVLEIEGVSPIEEVPDGEVRYYINKKVVFPNGYAQGDVVLQNPEACDYVLQFRFYLADGSSSEPVYTSPMIRPGQYLNGDKLGRYLPSGGYDCTYTVTAYEPNGEAGASGMLSGFLHIDVMS
jgi:hypothetical protein